MTNAGPGRPRLSKQRRPGPTAAAEILDAAAELFTTKGFASTSTRQIADAVGMRQASLYHHFATKDDILAALLERTVSEALALADTLADGTEPSAVRLYALLRFDADQLLSSRWNLGALYLLPELRTDRFAPFREERQKLRSRYRQMAELVLDELGADEDIRAGLPFRIVETVINERSDTESGDGPGSALASTAIADAGLRVLGWTTVAELAAPAEVLLAAYRRSVDDAR
ncbi:TetR/AcrR family transcriptional regulator [Rhodococcus sp. NPDC003318]|uniref:TetR/AcrR family transcriptional regulator n=1 Tax=Rhodococcus sp. NPDC003318 TaxID=3364503 RepID=UPI003691D9CA